MAIAHDAVTRFPSGAAATDTTAGDRTFTHTPTGTPKGVVVMVAVTGTAAPCTGVLYGGKRMKLEQDRTDTTEAGRVQIYSLAQRDVPTGAQIVTIEGATATAKWVTCATVTAATAHTKVADSQQAGSASSANPTVVLTRAVSSMCYGILHTGAAAPSATPLAGVTLIHSMDYGALGAQSVRATAAGTGAFNLGVTLGADDWAMVGVALIEWTPPDGLSLGIQEGGTTVAELDTSVSGIIPNVEVKAGANTIMLLRMSGEGNGAGGNGTSLSWNGTSFTLLKNETPGSWSFAEVWYIENPPQGLGSVSIVTTPPDLVHVVVTVLDGANIGAPFTTPVLSQNAGPGGGTPSLTYSPTPDPTTIMFDVLAVDSTSSAPTSGSGQTLEYADNDVGHTSRFSREQGTVDGVMSWSAVSAQEFSYIAVALLQKTVGGTTYQKTGSITAGGRMSAADVAERAEAGSLVATGRVSGAVSFETNLFGSLVAGTRLSGASAKEVGAAAKTGSITAGTRLAGVDAAERAETGALIADTLLAGADIAERSETGALLTTARLSGADVAERAEAGSLLAVGRLSGADARDAVEAGALVAGTLLAGVGTKDGAKAGSLTATGRLSGADAAERSETGALLAAARFSGAKALERAEAGSIVARGLLAGAETREYLRAGSVVAGALLRGVDASERAETGTIMLDTLLAGIAVKEGAGKAGSIVARAIISGADSVERTKSGSLLAAALLRGADSFVASETGALTTAVFGSGADVYQASKSGSLVAGTALGGEKSREISTTGSLIARGILAAAVLEIVVGQIEEFIAGGRTQSGSSGRAGSGSVGRTGTPTPGQAKRRIQ